MVEYLATSGDAWWVPILDTRRQVSGPAGRWSEDTVHEAMDRSVAGAWAQSQSCAAETAESLAHTHLFLVEQLFPRSQPILHAACHRLLGAAYHRQGRHGDADDEHEHAYRAAVAAGDPRAMAECRSWQAYGAKAVGNHARSLESLESAIHFVSGRGEPLYARLHAALLATAAQDAAYLHDDRKAGSYLYASEALLEQAGPGPEFDREMWLESSGFCALYLGQDELAIRRLDQTLREGAPLPHQVIRRTALAQAHARRRDRDAALAMATAVLPNLKTAQSRELNRYLLGFTRRDLPAAFGSDSRCHAFAEEAATVVGIG